MPDPKPTLDATSKIIITFAWLVWSAIPSVILTALKISMAASSGTDASVFLHPFLWFVTAALTSPPYARMLGEVEVDGSERPPPQRALLHLPPACAQLVTEAEAIQMNLDDLDEALLRAWQLTQELERGPVALRSFIEDRGASLQDVHELVRVRSEPGRKLGRKLGRKPGLSEAGVRSRLAQVLLGFVDALAQPSTTTFR